MTSKARQQVLTKWVLMQTIKLLLITIVVSLSSLAMADQMRCCMELPGPISVGEQQPEAWLVAGFLLIDTCSVVVLKFQEESWRRKVWTSPHVKVGNLLMPYIVTIFIRLQVNYKTG